MPIRWALFNPKNRKEVIIATEVGVWSTDDITASSPVWTASNNGLAHTRVDMLQYRTSDSLIMASTHGRGAFTGRFKSAITVTPPTASFTASKSTVCIGESVTYRSTSTGNPTSHNWTVSSGSPSSGTLDSLVVTYSTAGTKTVKLVVSNAGGSDSVTQTLVTVVSAPNASLSSIGPFCTNESNISLTNGSPSGGTYSGTGVSGSTFSPSTAGAGSHTLKYVVSNSSGCKDSATTSITVNAAPSATLGSIGPFCTSDPNQSLTQGSPSGGVYSGPGVSGTTFSPSSAGAGSHTIKYVVTNSNGCKDSATTTVTVSSGSSASASAVPNQCVNGQSITLSNATPSGGTYNGTGVSSGMFNPATAGVGTHTIKYVVGSGNCKDSTTFTIQVMAAPNASLGSIGPFCSGDPNQTLTQGSPSGGVYSGTGVSGNTFSPSTAGVGSHIIKYVVTNSSGCKDSTTTTVVVNSNASASASSLPDQCANAPAFTLSNGSPSGGSYSGTGVSSGMFNPATAGIGTHTIKYVVGSGSCKDSTTFTIRVILVPSVSMGNLGPFCTGDPAQTLTQGSPSGGVYSGPGVSGSTFTPNTAGVGTHTIKYVFTNSNGCKDSASTSVTVNSGTTPTLGSFSDMCEDDSPLTLTGGTPSGGTYSGTGVSSGIFNPSIAGPGTHTISYTHTNACGKSATSAIQVITKPNVSTSGDTSVCMGESIRLLAIGATSYSWTPTSTLSGAGTSTPLASPSTTTTYTVVGTDSGCTASSSLIVTVNPLPIISAGSDDTACTGVPYQLMASGGTSYLWSPGTGLSANNLANPTATITASQVYSVTGTDSKGCSNTDSVFIAVKANPTATLSNFSDVCEGDGAFTLTQGSPAGGMYSGAAVVGGKFDPKRVGAGVTVVYYSISDGKCVGIDSAQVIVIGAANISWITPLQFCENDSAIFPEATPTGGAFSGNAVNGGKIDPPDLGVGNYNIEYEYTDNDGCKTFDRQELVVNPSDSIGSIQGVFRAIVNRSYNYHVAAVNGASYHWTLTGGRFQAKNNNSVTVKWGSGPKGILKVVQTNVFGCMDSTEVELGVDPLSENEYALGEAVLRLYPNPSSSEVQVELSGIEEELVAYSVLDLSGKTLISGTMDAVNKNANTFLNVSEFENGLYFFSIESKGETLVVPLLVNH
jgi:PKD repeat protein